MKCPHCMVEFIANGTRFYLTKDANGLWYVVYGLCISCNRSIIYLQNDTEEKIPFRSEEEQKAEILPKTGVLDNL